MIVFATNNSHKLEEVRRMAGHRLDVRSLADIGCTADIPETADTLDGNAELKARFVADRFGGVDCFADDTGLEVEALGGAPGVYSARYAGPGHDSVANVAQLLREMQGVENRRARFRTVIALLRGGRLQLVEGIVEGTITTEPHGADGFGYDPVFRPDGCTKTFAEMTPDEKNAISHRGRAMSKLMQILL
jgi:XTP/dITP diphosphohydrolase